MKYQLANHISLTEVDDEAVLLDLNAGSYYGLNHIGAQFLSELQAEKTVEQAITVISDQYQNSAATIQQDLEELLQQLLDKELITSMN